MPYWLQSFWRRLRRYGAQGSTTTVRGGEFRAPAHDVVPLAGLDSTTGDGIPASGWDGRTTYVPPKDDEGPRQ